MKLRWLFLLQGLACGVFAPVAVAQPTGWTAFTDHQGTSIEYTAHLFPTIRGTQRGRTFITADGRASLDVYVSPKARGETPAQLLRRTFPHKRSLLSYDRVARNFFAISARHRDRILYRRCNFRGSTNHCIDLTYPLSEKRAWDETVTRISRSLRPL